jgi:hypothetical protein
VRAVVLVAAGSLVLLPGPAATAAPKVTSTVYGGWVGELPCVVTAATLNTGGPAVVPVTCESGTTWDGAWTGHTRYVIATTADLATGDSSGTIDETFIGVDTATSTPGTLHLTGTVTAHGADITLVVDEHIVGGSGAFDGMTGHAVFEGTQLSGLVGHGGYHADITRPAR